MAIGTRLKIIDPSCRILALDTNETINLKLIHTDENHNHELNDIFFDDFHLRKPDYYLYATKNSVIETKGQIQIIVDTILEKEKPQVFLVLKDTDSCLSTIPIKKHEFLFFYLGVRKCYFIQYGSSKN